MNSKTIPPQAYTRETLAKAYEWLRTQPLPIRERASSTDALVSLFLQARKNGSPPLEVVEGGGPFEPTLAHVQSFKEDLRSVAQGLQQFDEPDPSPKKTGASATFKSQFSSRPSPSYQPISEPVVSNSSSYNHFFSEANSVIQPAPQQPGTPWKDTSTSWI